jgi:hypothetical protein
LKEGERDLSGQIRRRVRRVGEVKEKEGSCWACSAISGEWQRTVGGGNGNGNGNGRGATARAHQRLRDDGGKPR